jgi:hypothetical protein
MLISLKKQKQNKNVRAILSSFHSQNIQPMRRASSFSSIFVYFHLLSIDDIHQLNFARRMGSPFPEQSSVLSIFEKKTGKCLIHDVTMLSNKE